MDTIRGKTKPILLIGMDKVADWHQLSAIEKVSLQDLDVGHVASSSEILQEVCPKVKELNLRKTLFGNWADVAKLGRGLPKLRNLMLSDNRFDKLPHPLPATHTLRQEAQTASSDTHHAPGDAQRVL